MSSIKLLFAIILCSSVLSLDKAESFKQSFKSRFIVQRLIHAQQSVHEGVEKYNKKNVKNPIKLDDRKYVLTFDRHKITFTYLDIVMRKVAINGVAFSLNPDESKKDVKKRLFKFFPKRKQSFYRFFVEPAHASEDEAFDAILNAVLHMTNYTSSFWDGSHLDESRKIFDEIGKKNKECQDLKASGKRDLIGGDSVSDFVSSILYSTKHEELESFKSDSRALLLNESSISGKNEEDFKERVSDLRGCGVLGYMLAKHELGFAGSLTSPSSRSLNNLSAYGSGRSVNTSVSKTQEFCRTFDELASCVAELTMFDEAVYDKFQRDEKQLKKILERKTAPIYKSDTIKK